MLSPTVSDMGPLRTSREEPRWIPCATPMLDCVVVSGS